MRRKDLAKLLSNIEPFSQPKQKYEQYITPTNIAADILWHAFMSGDISEKIVCDLGAGTGTFSIGCLALEAKKVFSVDIDSDALNILENTAQTLIEPSFLEKTLEILNKPVKNCTDIKADTVFMNPPFGTWTPHADSPFIDKAIEIAPVIYTIHKNTPDVLRWLDEKIEGKAKRDWTLSTYMEIPQSYSHHKKKVYKVHVLLIRLLRR